MRYILALIFSGTMCLAQAGTAAEDEKRYQDECKPCARVLVSRLDSAERKLHDNERTEAQAQWLEQDAKLAKSGKVKPRLWYTEFRKNAEYNVVWSLQLDSPNGSQKMDAWVWVYEVSTGRKLFQTWHHSIYWQKDHPEQQCLADAMKFLRTRKVTPDGVTFATHSDPGDYFPAPGEAR